MPTLVKITSSKLFILLSIPTWGVGSILPNVMTKLKKDENLAGLIWASKVFYAMSLRDVWDSQNWTKSSSKKECEKKSFNLWITMNWKWFMTGKFHHIQFSFQICVVLQKHVFSKLYSLVCVYIHFRIRHTTKEAFIIHSMKIILVNWQLYTWQYVQFAQNVIARYKSANGLPLKFISESEGASN
jgi:hypothetical protein